MEERLVRDFADLVKYEPGVYIENNVTRLGLNGFNIRGIGGNRVMTQVDGVQTSEQFDFGPFNVHQVGLDIDALKTVEIVRSANSALYGSDALGGVVSLFTKDPADYLNGRGLHLGAKTTWDGRSDAINGNLALAAGTERLQGSLFASAHRGNEIRNKGTVESADDTRTAPNPQDIRGLQLLAKLVFTPSPGNMLRTSAEAYDTHIETEWFSDRGLLDFGRFQYHTGDSDAIDTQDRLRVSVDHTLVDRGLDQVSWRLYGQFNDTAQVVDRERMTFGFGPPFPSLRHGTLDFEQVGYGASLQGQQWIGDPERGVLFTAGASYRNDYFDILCDRTETHGITGDPVPTSLIAPNEGVLGLRYVRPSGRWGSELSVRLVEAYQHGSEQQFTPESYRVVDLVGFVSLAESLTFRLGLLNLTDSKYFEWWNVRGRPANDPVLDRYTSPGTSVVASLGYDW